MNDETVIPNDAGSPRRAQFGLKNLLVLVAVCGLFAWAGWKIWANLDEDETARNLKRDSAATAVHRSVGKMAGRGQPANRE